MDAAENDSMTLGEFREFVRRMDKDVPIVAEGDGVPFKVADIRIEQRKTETKLILELQ